MLPALLFTTPQCPHCPGMKAALAQIQSEGLLGTIEIVDATAQPERAQALHIQSVPWLRLGELIFEGQMGRGDLRAWAQTAHTAIGIRRYFFSSLKNGKRAHVESVLRAQPQYAALLGDLIQDPEASMAVRIGIGAVLEELQGSAIAEAMVPALAHILTGGEARDRADAAHFLSLIATPSALSTLRAALQDSDEVVRAIAIETLTEHEQL